jgi:hypothetical protein
MTHVPIFVSLIEFLFKSWLSFLINLAKSKYSYYVESIIYQYKF